MVKKRRASFGARLMELREAAGLSREQLAERAGLTRQYITGIEAGRRPNPSWETVAKLCAALDVTPDRFYS